MDILLKEGLKKNITETAKYIKKKLEDYDKSSEVDKKIADSIKASEAKIFGDGELAEAFDTIKEIGDYLKDHDDVAVGLTAEINKRVLDETYQQDKKAIENRISANETNITKLQSEKVNTSDLVAISVEDIEQMWNELE